MKKIKGPYQYGKHPNPTNWHEAADALKSLHTSKTNPLVEKLSSIEQLLKDKR